MENRIGVVEYPVIGSDFASLGDPTLKIRKFLERFMYESGEYRDPQRNKEIIRRFGVCCYEAESNLAIHSFFGVLKAYVYSSKVKGITKDAGPGIKSLLLALTPGYSTASERARELGFGAGMGLKNILKISDFFLISSIWGKGTTLTFEIWKEENSEKRWLEMKIKELIMLLKLEVLTKDIEVNLEREIDCAYACDLLSFVLSKGKEESAWLTVQTNMNIVGVASIKRIPIIIVTEGSFVPDETIRKAEENSIIIARSSSDTFEISGKLYELLRSK